jgi:hypothetical protein
MIMFDSSTFAELARLSLFLRADDVDIRARAAAAIAAILHDHGTDWDAWCDYMHDVAQPLIARLRHLPHLAAPPDLRPGGVWRPTFFKEGTVGYATRFDNGVIATVGPDPRTEEVAPAWLATIDYYFLRDAGAPARFATVEAAINMVEGMAPRLFREPAFRAAIDPAGGR